MAWSENISMLTSALDECAAIAPLQFITEIQEPCVLAVIIGIVGPSYRPLGAMMAISESGQNVGTLSSGCVEADILLHAQEALKAGSPKVVKYGEGSPYMDIVLPCGGGLEIALIPKPDPDVIRTIAQQHSDRETTGLMFDLLTGSLAVNADAETGFVGDRFIVKLEPETKFYIFGKGPEAATFASLAHASGFPYVLLSPDEETLEAARTLGGETRHLNSPIFPSDLQPDRNSAIVLFFHDHDWEPPILQTAITSPAFYIGAQGSQRAAAARKTELEAAGLSMEELDRIRGPIGLIPSARDARKLAVSVLADVLFER